MKIFNSNKKLNFRLNKKSAYDFIYIYIFLQISVLIFLILILYISYDKPSVFSKIVADDFVSLTIYSDNSIFDLDSNIKRVDYGVLNLKSLDQLDNRYFVGSFNEFVSAQFKLFDKKDIKVSYYNKKTYDNWLINEPVNVENYKYSIPVWYYNNSKDNLTQGLLILDVYVSADVPYTFESKIS